MPRIENDPTVRPLRARITDTGDRARILPELKPTLWSADYTRGWFDGRTDAERTTLVLAILSAIAAFIVGALLPTFFHR